MHTLQKTMEFESPSAQFLLLDAGVDGDADLVVDRRTLSLCSIISCSCQYSRSVWILVDEHFQTFEPLPRSESACAHPLAALAPALCILPRHGVIELAERLVNLHLSNLAQGLAPSKKNIVITILGSFTPKTYSQYWAHLHDVKEPNNQSYSGTFAGNIGYFCRFQSSMVCTGEIDSTGLKTNTKVHTMFC
jgi:hypothetical protein